MISNSILACVLIAVGCCTGSNVAATDVELYETWVDSARIGDWAVIRKGTQEPYRMEVKEINDKFVVCELAGNLRGKEYVSRWNFRRKPTDADQQRLEGHGESEMKFVEYGKSKMGTRSVDYSFFRGHIKNGAGIGRATGSGQGTTVLIQGYEKYVCEEAPFGGIIKARRAIQKSNIDIQVKSGVSASQDIGTDEYELVFEMLDFGRGAPVEKKQGK